MISAALGAAVAVLSTTFAVVAKETSTFTSLLMF